MGDYLAGRELQQALLALVESARVALRTVYESDLGIEQKRIEKGVLLKSLAADAAAEIERSGRNSSPWLSGELNNARLISLALYEGRLPVFRALFLKCDERLDCFYAEVQRLAAMDLETREAALSTGDLLRFDRGPDQR